jgi:thiol-disulfide isomerase/thioredoxin
VKPGAESREPRAESRESLFATPRRRRFRGRRLLAPCSWLLALGLLAALLVPRPALAQDDQVGLARGSVVRPFPLADIDGKPVDLAQVIGHRPVLVEFWATWCSNCAALEPRMRAAFQRHGDQVEFLVVAVGVNQTPASVRRHVARRALPANRVLWDGNGAAVRAFRAPATSYVCILDRQGRVAYTGIGPDQDLEAALAEVTH